MCKVAWAAENENMKASQISERDHSVHLERKFLRTLLSITNRLCLASVRIGGQALLLAVFMAEVKSFVTNIYNLQIRVELLHYLPPIFISSLHLS